MNSTPTTSAVFRDESMGTGLLAEVSPMRVMADFPSGLILVPQLLLSTSESYLVTRLRRGDNGLARDTELGEQVEKRQPGDRNQMRRSRNPPKPRLPTKAPSRITARPRTKTLRTAPSTDVPSYGV